MDVVITNLLLLVSGLIVVGVPLIVIVWIYRKYIVKTAVANEKPWDWKILKNVLVIECIGFGAFSLWLLSQVFLNIH